MAGTPSCNLIGISGKIGSGKDTFAKMIQVVTYLKSSTDAQYEFIVEKLSNSQFNWDSYSIENQNTNWRIKKFADTLKDIVCLLIGCTRRDLENPKFKDSNLPERWNRLFWQEGLAIKPTKFPATKFFKDKFPSATEKSMTVREMLQLVGTDCMRDNLHPQVWVNALFSSYVAPIITIDQSGKEADQTITISKWIITDVRFPNEFEAIKDRGGIMIRISRPAELYGGIVSNHESETALDHYKPFETWDEYIKNTGTLSNLYEVAKEIVTKYNLK